MQSTPGLRVVSMLVALEWAVSDESGLNQETITCMGHHLQNEDPLLLVLLCELWL